MTVTLTPIKAIRANCLDCCLGSYKEVKLCPCDDCALYPYRLGHRPTTGGPDLSVNGPIEGVSASPSSYEGQDSLEGAE